MRRARVLVWSLRRASLLRIWWGLRNFAAILSAPNFHYRAGRSVQEDASQDHVVVDFVRFLQFYPISQDPARKLARLFISRYACMFIPFVFGRSLASSAPGLGFILCWGLYGYLGLFACCLMRFLMILKKMHSAVVIRSIMFHLFCKCQWPCLRILLLQFSGLHWTGQWFLT